MTNVQAIADRFNLEAVFLFPWAVLFSSATSTPAGKGL